MPKRKIFIIISFIIILLLFLFSACTSDNHTLESDDKAKETHTVNTVDKKLESDDKAKDAHTVNTADKNIEEYTINDPYKGLRRIDFNNAYDLCVLFLNECYYAAYSPAKLDSLNLDKYVRNKNLKNYIYEKLQFNIEYFSKSYSSKLHTGLKEVEWHLDNELKYVYFSIVTKNRTGSSIQQLIVSQENGKLYISDWYSGPKAMIIYSLDDGLRGNTVRIDNPNIWDDKIWVDEIFAKVDGRKQNKLN